MRVSERSWPPLIVAARIPFWVKVRDLVLTWLMWGLFLAMLVDEADIVLTTHSFSVDIDWAGMWRELVPFVALAATLAAFLFVASQFTRHRRRRSLLLPGSRPLTLAEHAERGSVSEEQLSHARDLRIVFVHVDAGRRLRFERS